MRIIDDIFVYDAVLERILIRLFGGCGGVTIRRESGGRRKQKSAVRELSDADHWNERSNGALRCCRGFQSMAGRLPPRMNC